MSAPICKHSCLRLAAALLCAALLSLAPAPVRAAPVDDARLRAAGGDAADWLTYGHGYDNHRYSTLSEVTRENVTRLVPKWIYQTGLVNTFQTQPLVADGRMYLSTPYNHVVALDAATGEPLWRYAHQMKVDRACCGVHNRGVALGYGRVYMITADARLLALSMEDGRVLWDVPVADPNTGEAGSDGEARGPDSLKRQRAARWTGFTGNMAPIVYDGMVIVGVTGAGYTMYLENQATGQISMLGFQGRHRGLRAFMTAYAADTGELIWRWYSTADHGWEGSYTETTGFGEKLGRDTAAERAAAPRYPDAALRGGGSIYAAPAIDPELGLIYFGTGNPSPPLDGETRPGDNLYTASVVALDAHTGKLRWYHQQVPHDRWAYEVASPPVLLDVMHGGRRVAALAQPGKAGWVYFYDRATGEVLLRSEAFVPQQNLFHAPTREGIVIAPGLSGGAAWSPSAWSAETGWVYVPAIHHPARYILRDGPAEGGRDATMTVAELVDPKESGGTLTAIDPATGRIQWQDKTAQPLAGGVAATAGGLIFMGQSDGFFTARDARDGKLLWKFRAGAGVNAPPVVYRADGHEMIAVAAGGHRLFHTPMGNAVIAFGLPGD